MLLAQVISMRKSMLLAQVISMRKSRSDSSCLFLILSPHVQKREQVKRWGSQVISMRKSPSDSQQLSGGRRSSWAPRA